MNLYKITMVLQNLKVKKNIQIQIPRNFLHFTNKPKLNRLNKMKRKPDQPVIFQGSTLFLNQNCFLQIKYRKKQAYPKLCFWNPKG